MSESLESRLEQLEQDVERLDWYVDRFFATQSPVSPVTDDHGFHHHQLGIAQPYLGVCLGCNWVRAGWELEVLRKDHSEHRVQVADFMRRQREKEVRLGDL